MAMHPETAAWAIAGGMVNMLRGAAQHASDRRDQASLDAWHGELAAARDDAAAMGRAAAKALREVAALDEENEALHAEVAKLRTLLAQRNELIRKLTQ